MFLINTRRTDVKRHTNFGNHGVVVFYRVMGSNKTKNRLFLEGFINDEIRALAYGRT